MVYTFVLGAILGHSATLWAQSEDKAEVTPEILAKELDDIDSKLKLDIRNEDLLADFVKRINEIKQIGNKCVPEIEQALELSLIHISEPTRPY